MNETRRLPLWKNCLDVMRQQGVEYGKEFSTAFFEAELSQPAHSMRFSIDISRIRRELEKDGFYLSGQGMNGHAFVVVPAADNHEVMKRYLRQSRDLTVRSVTLGSATALDQLTESERMRHMQVLERAQVRQALTGKTEGRIHKLVNKTEPSLLRALQAKEKP